MEFVMNEALMRFKEELINSGVFKRTPTRPDQYRGQLCPKCGDIKWHCYVKITMTNEDPPLWHCFKCNEGGIVNKTFLTAYGLNVDIPKGIKYHKRVDVDEAVSTKINSLTCDDNDNISKVSQYIHSRIGIYPTLTHLQVFRYVGNPVRYVKEFFGENPNVNMNKRCWFQLTNGNIIGRSYVDNDSSYRWLRYNTKCVRGRGIYTIKTPVDTYETINVIISEGIMDAIGLYYNYPIQNAFFISTLGSDYNHGIQHVLNMGIFGKSVNIHIFKDSDVDVVNLKKNIRKLFNNICVYQNLASKDYGVPVDMLEITRVQKFK